MQSKTETNTLKLILYITVYYLTLKRSGDAAFTTTRIVIVIA